MKNVLLALFLATIAISPARAADVVVNVPDGDTYRINVWSNDSSQYLPAFICMGGDQALCDMPNNGVMRYGGSTLEEVFGQFAPSYHIHAISDIDDLAASLAGKQAAITPGAAIADAATNGATNAATNAQTNATAGAVTNLATNYNVLSALLDLANGLNAANSAQNDLATKYNALVGKYNEAAGKANDNASKYNDLAGKYNTLATKFNTLLTHLEAQGIQTP